MEWKHIFQSLFCQNCCKCHYLGKQKDAKEVEGTCKEEGEEENEETKMENRRKGNFCE